MTGQASTVPVVPTVDSARFWEGCAAGELRLPWCPACELAFWHPRAHCPRCGGGDVSTIVASGGGTVWAQTEVQISFGGQRWAGDVPYTVLSVDLDEGCRIVSRLAPDSPPVPTGARVRLTFVDAGSVRLPMFRSA